MHPTTLSPDAGPERGEGISVEPARLADVGLYATSLALASGLAYWVALLVQSKVLGLIVFVSPDAIWMAPAASLSLFLPLAVPVWIGVQFRGGTPLAAGFFAWLGVFSVLLPFPQVARWAAAVLATGVAVQIFRLVGSRRLRRRSVGIACLTMTGFVMIATVGRLATGGLERARAVGSLSQAQPGAPNVLLIIWDTVRSGNLSLFGYERTTTPTLERLAKSSTLFDRAVATAPWTLPTHGTLFTGRYGGALEGDWLRPIVSDAPTLAEAFRDRGYRTGGFVGNLLYTSRESGLTRGFIDYRDYRLSPGLILMHSPIAQTQMFQRLLEARSLGALRLALRPSGLTPGLLPADDVVPAREVTDDFLAWQDALGGRPFFAFLNYFDAHGPYRAPDSVRVRLQLSNKAEDRYDAAIAHLDEELARLLETLAQRGSLDNTIVVVTSDHGELFGEHDLTGHANALYLPLLQVPLLIRYPAAVPMGVRIAQPVSLRDVPATVVDLAGIATSAGLPGYSLSGRWQGHSAKGSAIVSELIQGRNVNPAFPNARTALASILNERYHYIRNGLGTEQLFDYIVDPEETVDLAQTPGAADVLPLLRQQLDSVLAR